MNVDVDTCVKLQSQSTVPFLQKTALYALFHSGYCAASSGGGRNSCPGNRLPVSRSTLRRSTMNHHSRFTTFQNTKRTRTKGPEMKVSKNPSTDGVSTPGGWDNSQQISQIG